MRSNQSCVWYSHSPAYQVPLFQGHCDSRAVDQAGRNFEVAADRSSPCSDFSVHSQQRTQQTQQQGALKAVEFCLMHLCNCVSQASSALQSPPAFALLSARIQTDFCKRNASRQQTAAAMSGRAHSIEPDSETPCSRRTSRGRKPNRRRSGSCAGRFASASSAAGSGEWKLPSFLQWKQWKPPR